MSEYLVQRQSLENIADEIRVLSGTTEPLGLDEMATNVNDANDEVADQTELLAQLVSALEGKSVSGGGGGSSNYETTEIYINGCRNVYYTGVENGMLVAKASEGSSRSANHTIQACCNMPVVCGYVYNETPSMSNGITKIGGYSTYIVAYTIPYSASYWEIDFRGGGSSN